MLARIRKSTEERDRGFTLIELLVVVIIIGILAAIAIPTFLSQRENGWQAQAESDLRNLITAAESYAVRNDGSYSGMDTDYTADVAVLEEGLDLNVTTPVTLTGVSDDDFCIEVVHPGFETIADGTFSYTKSADEIVNAGC